MRHLVGINELPPIEKSRRLHHMHLVHAVRFADEVCKWVEVECNNGIVEKITWETDHRFQNPDLRWIPSSVQILFFEDIRLGSTIDTRYLPRELTACKMKGCGIRGEIDLRTVPSKRCATLDFRENLLTGVVSLTKLPQSMVALDFSANRIRTVVVDNSLLPKTLRVARFSQNVDVKIVVLDAHKLDERIRVDASWT